MIYNELRRWIGMPFRIVITLCALPLIPFVFILDCISSGDPSLRKEDIKRFIEYVWGIYE